MTSGKSADWLRWSNSAEVADHRPGEDDDGQRGHDEDELGEQIERLAHLRRHHADDDVHPDLPAGPGDDAIAEKHAADHQEQHDLFRPVDGGIEEIAADDVGEIEGDAGDQQHAGERAEDGNQRTHAAAIRCRSFTSPRLTRPCGPGFTARTERDRARKRSEARSTLQPTAVWAIICFALPIRTRVFTALFSSGLSFDRSSPMVEIFAIIAACSPGGKLISSPPLSVQTSRCLAKKSFTNGTISVETFAASSRTIFCRSGGKRRPATSCSSR